MTETNKGKITEYRMVVMRGRAYEYTVKATSFENAAKRLKARLERDSDTDNATYEEPADAQPGSHFWFAPEDMEWFVGGGEIPTDPSGETVAMWNGAEVKRRRFPGKGAKADRRSSSVAVKPDLSKK